MPALTVRSLSEDTLDLFQSFAGPVHPEIGRSFLDFDDMIARRVFRPQWCFVAERDGRVHARAAFWAPPGLDKPFLLLWLDLDSSPDRREIGTELLRRAYAELFERYGDLTTPRGDRPAYDLYVPVDWSDRDDVRTEVEDRIACARAAGMGLFAERLGFDWTPQAGVPARSSRLRFEPAEDDATVLELFKQIDVGTLDAHGRLDLARLGADGAAKERFDELLDSTSPRNWWRFGYDSAGQLVGIVVPTGDGDSGEIGYIGVADAHRGHGYSADLIAEGTDVLAQAGAQHIHLQTDALNQPMVNAFRNAGYQIVSRLLIYV